MNNLQRVYRIWNNLDESYENMKGTNGITSKRDFIEKLVGYSVTDNSTQVEYIRSKLNEETNTYTSAEMKIYNQLSKILTGVDYLFKLGKLNNIKEDDSLNNILNASIVETNTIKETINKLPDSFFESLSPITSKRFQVPNTYTIDEIYDLTGNLGETFMLTPDGTVKEYIVNDVDNEFFVFNDTGNVLDLFSKLEKEHTKEFAMYCINAYRVLKETNKLKPSSIFLSKKYYKVEGKSIQLKLGSEIKELKITPSKLISDVKLLGYNYKIKLKGHNVDIVLLDV